MRHKAVTPYLFSCFSAKQPFIYVYRWTIPNELAKNIGSIYVERAELENLQGDGIWDYIDFINGLTTEVAIFFNNPEPSTYQVRVVAQTSVNGISWKHEVDRSFLQITKGKKYEKHSIKCQPAQLELKVLCLKAKDLLRTLARSCCYTRTFLFLIILFYWSAKISHGAEKFFPKLSMPVCATNKD